MRNRPRLTNGRIRRPDRVASPVAAPGQFCDSRALSPGLNGTAGRRRGGGGGPAIWQPGRRLTGNLLKAIW